MGKVLELIPVLKHKPVTIKYKVVCCANPKWEGHTWEALMPEGTYIEATKRITELLKNGHNNVTLYRVQKTLLGTFQPRKDHGKVCLHTFGWECKYDHNHLEM